MFYAFYAPGPGNSTHTVKDQTGHWSGEVELRGLDGKSYRVTDYVHHKDFGAVTGPHAKLNVDFTDSLLLEATPAP